MPGSAPIPARRDRRIRLAVMDKWKPFRTSTRKPEHAPQAPIVFDKFHVLRHLSTSLDTVRKQEYARLSGPGRPFIKSQKYNLLSRWENLHAKGRAAPTHDPAMNATNSAQCDRDCRLDEVVTTYVKAMEADRAPSRDELFARDPDLADGLAAFIAAESPVNHLAAPLRVSEDDTAGRHRRTSRTTDREGLPGRAGSWWWK